MIKQILLILFTVLILSSCKNTPDQNTPEIISEYGMPPTIDGIFEENEWVDANKIHIDSTKTIYLKHDKNNLYIAVNGDGGNLYLLRDNKMYILHASFSLGWAEYVKGEGLSWNLDKGYEWLLYGIQKKSDNEIHKEISLYLQKNGWTGSLINLGNAQQTEFAISLRWLNMNAIGKSVEHNKAPKLLISSFQNLSPSECERLGITRKSLRLQWPLMTAPNDSINRGYTPKRINMDVSDWGIILLKK